MERYRSWMFVPGHIVKMVDKALGLPVDAIMLDIEDGVLPSSKSLARETIAAALRNPKGGPQRFVRINAIGHADAKADLEAAMQSGCDGIVAPKVETVDEIGALEALMVELERRRKISSPLRIVAAIESATGLLGAAAIAKASPRLCGLMLGAEDLSRDIGLPTQWGKNSVWQHTGKQTPKGRIDHGNH